jgi:hypothetical protein
LFKSLSWLRLVIGLVTGLILSYLVGCVYAYGVWNPPSNDWGSAKAFTDLILAALVVVGLVVAIFARKPLSRLFIRSQALGGAGLAGIVIGAVVLPIVQWTDVALDWRHIKSQLPAARDDMIAQLADIGVELKQAETIVVEGGDTAPDWFIFRLSRFTGHAIFVVPHDPNAKTATMRSYGAAAGATCAQTLPDSPTHLPRKRWADGDSCLIDSDVPDFGDWPSKGALLYVDWDPRQFFPSLQAIFTSSKHAFSFGSHYPTLELSVLKKPEALIQSPYPPPPYDTRTAPRTVWQNKCFFRSDDPFPFGRGIHLQACADLLDLFDVADRIFGPGPTKE